MTQTCCHCAELPPEILLMIFRYALAPAWMLRGTKSMVPYPQDLSSADLRMKLSILAVCKSWHRIGTELLYQTVTLRRITQLPIFVRALEGREELGSLVKRLDIDCFVPRGYSKLHETENRRIFKLCPNLSHVGFSPPFWIPGKPFPLPAMNSSITSLEFASDIPYSAVLPALTQLCHTLKSLVITLPAAYDDDHPILTFGSLQDLSVTLEPYSVISVSKWLIPNLRRLWLARKWCLHEIAEMRKCEEVLDAYGGTTTFLELLGLCPVPEVQQLLNRCPVLEHVVLHLSSQVPSLQLAHRTLKFVDIYVPAEALNIPFSRAGLPSLQSYRYLDFATSLLRDIPLSLDTCAEGENDDEEVKAARGPDVQNNVPKNMLVILGFSDGGMNGPVGHWPDHSDDYVPDSYDEDEGSVQTSDDEDSDSDSESDAVTASEDGGCLKDEFYDEDYWEIGRDEAIAMFYATHDEE
ncbi:hypothetical protein DFH06DRAFT_429069 [Mycena polygramma]|nr:hypothetical protein DFH06DRAFT_429069 [Mycena polygramma]